MYLLYLLSHCMQPEELWQQLAAARMDSAPVFPPLSTHFLILSPTTHESNWGYPIPFPPDPPKQRNRRSRKQKKEKKRQDPPVTYSPVSMAV